MGKLKKIEANQKTVDVVLVPFENVGWKTTTGTSLTFTAVQRDPDNGRPFSNLYSSFNLPLTSGQSSTYNSTWVDSGMSGLNQSDVIVVGIEDNQYGELIDGRTIKFKVPNNSGGTYTLYSSYYEPKAFSSDNSEQASYFGARKITGNPVGKPELAATNIAFLFSDDIKLPTIAISNTNISNWSNGWQTGVIPTGYVGGNIDTFRFSNTVSVSNTPKAYAQTADLPVGICYLDKGFVVITDPTIVSNFAMSAGTEDGTNTYSGNTSGFTNLYYTGDTAATAKVTITAFGELNAGDKVNLIASDGTNYNFVQGDQSSVNGTFEATTNNNTTATGLMNCINTSSGPSGTRFSATVNANVVTITQNTKGGAGNTTVTLTDSGTAGMALTSSFVGGSDLASCEFYSFEKEWVLSVNIVADSGEFYITENQSASDGSRPYYGAGGTDTGMEFKTPFGDINKIWDISDVSSTFITEVGLYDAQNRLLAVAIPDRPVEKPKNTPVTLTLKMKF